MSEWVSESLSVVSDSLGPHKLYNPWNSLQKVPEWVAFPFSKGSSQPWDRTQVSCITGGFFTSWATREDQECWSGQPIPSPADLPDPGIEPGLLHCRQILYQLSYQEDIHIQTYINIYLWNWITLLYTWNTVNQLYLKLKRNKNIVKCFFTVIF